MTTTFLRNPWQVITKAIKKAPGQCCVAVAYFGQSGSKLLPLKAGSTLVVNLSEAAVRAGQTNPGEIAKLLKRGVRVYSVNNLHAKVFVTPSRVIIGSSNVSKNSANSLIEAALCSPDRKMIKTCRTFVTSLCGEAVSLGYVKKLKKLWKPPKFFPGAAPDKKAGKRIIVTPTHNAAWMFPLTEGSWSARAHEAESHGKPKAKKRMRTPRQSDLDEFLWEDDAAIKKVKLGHLVAQVVETRGTKYVSPLGRVRHIERFREDGVPSGILFLEIPKKTRRKNLKRIRKAVASDASVLDAEKVRRIPEGGLSHELLQQWL